MLQSEEVQDAFDSRLGEFLDQSWHSCTSLHDKWDTLVSCVKDAANAAIPHHTRPMADWFLENEHTIRPILEKRNALLTTWLASGKEGDRQQYLKQKSAVQRLIRQVKNKWYQSKASEIERSTRGSTRRSGGAWKNIRQLQQASRGLRPAISKAVKDEKGELCRTQAECHRRWRTHFQRILNIEIDFDLSVIEAVRQRHLRTELDIAPTPEELEVALDALKSGKAGGKNGLLPEVIKRVGVVFDEYIQDLFSEVWNAGAVQRDWANAIIVAIPKKGDLRVCDNWRGISLLDVTGKLFARILQQRLQTVAEEELAESQCGFRRGWGCTDLVFCAKQLIEKTLEHEDTLYLTFVDLRKAYDSVPRAAMWRVLEKYGFPPRMVSLIRSFHEDMTAELRVQGEVLEGDVEVTNGLRQGCTMAPTLFNLFFNLVIQSCREMCRNEVGVTVLYKADGRLIGSRAKQDEAQWSELQFADDIAIIAISHQKMELAMNSLAEVTSSWGLTISTTKTKGNGYWQQ